MMTTRSLRVTPIALLLAGAVCVASAWFYRRAGLARRARQSAMIDEASEESFPASDPPAFTPTVLLH